MNNLLKKSSRYIINKLESLVLNLKSKKYDYSELNENYNNQVNLINYFENHSKIINNN
jgi:hypothetical protein